MTDRQALDAYLVAWRCATVNNLNEEGTILERLAGDMQFLSGSQPNEFSEWFASVNERDDLIVEMIVECIRTRLLSRNATGEIVGAVLHVWFKVIARPSVRICTQYMAGKSDCPVRWVMKAIQRHLCARPENSEEVKDDVVSVGLGCIGYVPHDFLKTR